MKHRKADERFQVDQDQQRQDRLKPETCVFHKHVVAKTLLKARSMSEHPRTIQVTAAILIREDTVLIAKRKSDDRQAGKWEFPGGKIEDGESPEQCLVREMKEECDIEVTVGEHLWQSRHRYEHGIITLMAYRTYWKAGTISTHAHEEIRWVPIHQLDRYDFSPADVPFVERLMRCEPGLRPDHR
jgi:8-oxo-dGTP diphosphatase